MRYIKKHLTLLLIGMLALLLLLYITHTFPPAHQFVIVKLIIPILIPFFILLFFTIFGFVGYFIKNKIQGILIGLFLIGYVSLRYYGFVHWFFIFLLITLFILTEIIILKTQ